MIAAGNRSGYNKTNLEEHRRLAMLFFARKRTDRAIHTDKEKKNKKGR